ncbi:hypothetical protein D3C87_132930 [compost metagenome]
MIIEQIYTGCLAQGAYYIQSGNEVAIIDPLREVAPYVKPLLCLGFPYKNELTYFNTQLHNIFRIQSVLSLITIRQGHEVLH